MAPILSLFAALALLGAAFTLIHAVSLWLHLPDLAALLLFAIPVVIYIVYCTCETRAEMRRSGIRIYLSFAAVVLAAGGLVFYIESAG